VPSDRLWWATLLVYPVGAVQFVYPSWSSLRMSSRNSPDADDVRDGSGAEVPVVALCVATPRASMIAAADVPVAIVPELTSRNTPTYPP
jgi:hypothetical protein